MNRRELEVIEWAIAELQGPRLLHYDHVAGRLRDLVMESELAAATRRGQSRTRKARRDLIATLAKGSR